MTTKDLLRTIRVEPGSPAGLADRETGSRLGLGEKAAGVARLAELVVKLAVLHNRLWAEGERSVLLVLQGLDASGKDGTITHILSGLRPQGCQIAAFKVPVGDELAHDYLWRVHAQCPRDGELTIFNRSHYEDVVAARVRGVVPEATWRKRFRHIREFERLLTDEGTTVVKVFLHVSPEVQRSRLQERLDNPEKAWKFRASDLDDRARWDDYLAAYDEAITETSTDWAPWHVVPADHGWVRNAAVAELLVSTLERLNPVLPTMDPHLRGLEIT